MNIRLICSPNAVHGILYKESGSPDEAQAQATVELPTVEPSGVFSEFAPDAWVCSSPDDVYKGLVGVVRSLAAPEVRGDLKAVELVWTHRSLVLIGRENRVLSEVLWWKDNQTPAPLDGVFERLDSHTREETRRPVSAGAWVVRTWTREWIEIFPRAPLGLPLDRERADYVRDPAWWDSMSLRRTFCPLLIPSGGILAQITTDLAGQLGVPAFTPVYGVMPQGSGV